MSQRKLIIATGHLCAGKTWRIRHLSVKLKRELGMGLASLDLAWIDRAAFGPDTEDYTLGLLDILEGVCKRVACLAAPNYSKALTPYLTEFGVPVQGKPPNRNATRSAQILNRLLMRLKDYDIGIAECRYMHKVERELLLKTITDDLPHTTYLNVMYPEPSDLVKRCQRRYPVACGNVTVDGVNKYYDSIYPGKDFLSEPWDVIQYCVNADEGLNEPPKEEDQRTFR